ncbi:hypothetical protein A9G24_03520 [Gilliamella sp. App6-5]|jgi:hypothetical protein|nr:hypothetical protein A9G24_03520 [Gilliamella apicola]
MIDKKLTISKEQELIKQAERLALLPDCVEPFEQFKALLKDETRVANQLRLQGIMVSGSGVRSIWLRHDLESFKKG